MTVCSDDICQNKVTKIVINGCSFATRKHVTL
jgi:hypothetical protein